MRIKNQGLLMVRVDNIVFFFSNFIRDVYLKIDVYEKYKQSFHKYVNINEINKKVCQ